jgi:hypothetical protein
VLEPRASSIEHRASSIEHHLKMIVIDHRYGTVLADFNGRIRAGTPACHAVPRYVPSGRMGETYGRMHAEEARGPYVARCQTPLTRTSIGGYTSARTALSLLPIHFLSRIGFFRRSEPSFCLRTCGTLLRRVI